MAHDTLLNYPDLNETFKFYTDASAFQLVAVISHEDKPIPFNSKKLTGSQHCYTVIERELIRIVETLK